MVGPPHGDLEAARPHPLEDAPRTLLGFLQRHAGIIGLGAAVLSAIAAAIGTWAAVKQAQIADLVATYQSVATSFPFRTQVIQKSITGYDTMLAICGSEAELQAITDAKSTWQFEIRVTRSKSEDGSKGVISVPLAINVYPDRTLGELEPNVFDKDRRCRGIYKPDGEVMSAFNQGVLKELGPDWHGLPFYLEGILRLTHRDVLGNPQTRYLRIVDGRDGDANGAISQIEAARWIEQNDRLKSGGFAEWTPETVALAVRSIKQRVR